jgi:hypothetical protein
MEATALPRADLPLTEKDAMLLAGHTTCCSLLLEEGADIEQRNVVSTEPLQPS